MLTRKTREGRPPPDCWNLGKLGLKEYIWSGSFLGWFVGLICEFMARSADVLYSVQMWLNLYLYLHSLIVSLLESRLGSTVEYQTMPFLRDVAHDGVLCTFSNGSAPEFINVQFRKFVMVFGLNLESSQTWGSVYNVYITTRFQTTFAQRGVGIKSVSRGDCDFCPNCVK